MIFVVRNWLVQSGQRRVYQKMMMAKIYLFDPSGREAHIDEAESDRKRLRDVIPSAGETIYSLAPGGEVCRADEGAPMAAGGTPGGEVFGGVRGTGPHRRLTRAHRWRRPAGPSRGGDVYMDAWRHHRRRAGNMVAVAEQNCSGAVQAERQVDLGLSGPEMHMIFIVRDRLIERRQIRVDQKMMMAGIRFVGTGGATPIPCSPKWMVVVGPSLRHPSGRRNSRGPWRRRRTAGGDVYMDGWREHRGRVRNMVLVAQQKL